MYYENEEFLGGLFVWRNTTATCAAREELKAEVEELKTFQSAVLAAQNSTAVERGGGGSATASIWVISVLVFCSGFPPSPEKFCSSSLPYWLEELNTMKYSQGTWRPEKYT